MFVFLDNLRNVIFMKWNFIDSGMNTGIYNMDFDLELTRKCTPEDSFFRLYRWFPYCISLGANQKIEEIDLLKASGDNVDVVKRPTGGRAILHSEEVTYSVVVHLDCGLSPSEIYKEINNALLNGLRIYDPRLGDAELENLQPDFKNVYKTPAGTACFATTAKSELKFSGKKLIGSAQRKLGSVILQHGSILCGKYHKHITRYLTLSGEERAGVAANLESKTIEIETILNEPVDYERLKTSLSEGFAEYFSGEER